MKRLNKPKVLLLIMLLAGIVGIGSAATIIIPDTTIANVGDVVDIPIVLDSAPNGLSGCSLEFSFANQPVADYVGWVAPLLANWVDPDGNPVGAAPKGSCPFTSAANRDPNCPYVDQDGSGSWNSGEPPVVPFPVDIMTFTVGDLNLAQEPGATNIDLGKVKVKGTLGGQTQLLAVVIKCDDDDGSPINPILDTGIVTVGVDNCPDDPNKMEPGVCGCGVADTDSDGDGEADCNDECPNDPAKTEPGICDCGVADTDSDGDLVADCDDGCDNDPAKVEPGQCGCGQPEVPGCGGPVDNCPDDPAKTEPGVCGCGVPDVDTDGDQIMDCVDRCPNDPTNTCIPAPEFPSMLIPIGIVGTLGAAVIILKKN